MKVYIITKGEYSDYSIYDATLDKEYAETLRLIYSDRHEQAEIMELDLAERSKEIEDNKDNYETIYSFYIEENSTVHDISTFIRKKGEFENYFTFNNWSINHRFDFYAAVVASNYDIAKKIALDKHAKMLAERLGI